jgi:hypothetical protein
MARIGDQKINAFLWAPRGRPWRWLLALAAIVSAAAHLPVISPHLAEAPYMGEEFIVLTAACLLLAGAAIMCDSAAVYSLGILTCGLAVIGYVATRLVAFPQLADDVGNWFEPLGVVAVLAESIAVVAAILSLRTRRTMPVASIPAQPFPLAVPAPSQVDPPAEVQEEAEADAERLGAASASPDSAQSWPVWTQPSVPAAPSRQLVIAV